MQIIIVKVLSHALVAGLVRWVYWTAPGVRPGWLHCTRLPDADPNAPGYVADPTLEQITAWTLANEPDAELLIAAASDPPADRVLYQRPAETVKDKTP